MGSVLDILAATAAFAGPCFGPAGSHRAVLRLHSAWGIGFTILAPRLPVYTPSRARVFRYIRWIVQVGLLLLAFGPGAMRMSWLLLLCVWQLMWVEWKRASIRRKLPVADWPRQLYL